MHRCVTRDALPTRRRHVCGLQGDSEDGQGDSAVRAKHEQWGARWICAREQARKLCVLAFRAALAQGVPKREVCSDSRKGSGNAWPPWMMGRQGHGSWSSQVPSLAADCIASQGRAVREKLCASRARETVRAIPSFGQPFEPSGRLCCSRGVDSIS